MRVMVIIEGAPAWEAGEPPDASLLTAMDTYDEELVRAGVMLDGERLQPSSKGVRVGFAGATRTVTDGPFTEAADIVTGYWLWQVRSIDEAIEWAKRCPTPMAEGSVLEIRAVLDPDGSGSDPTPSPVQRRARRTSKD